MTAKQSLQFHLIEPHHQIADFVYCFSSFSNMSTIEEGIIIPNGKIDLILSLNENGAFHITLLGLETQPKIAPKQPISKFFSVSFHPLAVEYILKMPVAKLLNTGRILPDNFWDFTVDDLTDFEAFCLKVTDKVISLLPDAVDQRKRNLFNQIIVADGDVKVNELAANIGWSPRQINQYFNRQLGVSLKSYCNILRFQASLQHIWEGNLYPQLNYTDQSHFIKEVKKLSGVSPKELNKNENSRFLQFLVYGKK
ncbi:AraC-type DNA-binding protein [Chryseobacterium taichungense]|uniref:AraC-type DNA-binding protein n=1 Tax=Chryseobacterium taichungense TaxID=295069 RepID=A0A1H8CES3_9FLAO|nr:AraC family transcriptional regulator [Chryseobacterium taichungense]SEM93399.1 AraC-type DNA-binding protein [Chryseobacterium taichungense]